MIDQQHPIPQQISTYQFRLVGDMTLNQFFQVAGGALVSVFIYASSMSPILKWPLLVASFLTGIAFAFFPFQDRPLLTWIILFFKAIYSPTLYVWKKGEGKREFFASEAALPQVQIIETPQTQILPQTEAGLEKTEEEFLNKVSSNLGILSSQVQPANIATSAQPPIPTTQTTVQEVNIPENKTVTIEAKPKEAETQKDVYINKTQATITPSQTQDVKVKKTVSFLPEASPPEPPNKPNLVVGQVFESDGKIIANAILEILDNQGRPARALKSNRLGHFMIVTPLQNGVYSLRVEKEGYVFEPASFEARGEIIPPIAVIANKLNN